MNLLYIDANIYLGFYNTNRSEFKKLLLSVIELKDQIFFTEQFKNEIDRNKLNVFQQSIDNYIKQVSLIKTVLPEHLDDDFKKLSEWNTNRKKLEESILSSNDELLNIFKEVLSDISYSKDRVSKELLKLYDLAYKPTPKELEDARLRREIGNPPGKRIDTLGDQLSWEMLLNRISKIKKLWIISSDRDYFTEHKNGLYLNPILTNDIVKKNSHIQIKVYNKLSEALKDFSKEGKVLSIPSNRELDSISLNESLDFALNQGEAYFSNFTLNNNSSDFDVYDLELLKLLANGYGLIDIVKEFDKIGYFSSLSAIEKRINKLKTYFNAQNTAHLVYIVKDRGII